MDLAIIETGNGGDLKLNGNDLATQGGWGNMPYLGMFGGNPESVTKKKLPTEQAFDWWGNNLLMTQNQSIQFNSLLEKKLCEIALNSSGRLTIEQTANKDLEFMKAFADISVTATILSDDKLKIFIRIREPQNLGGRVPDQYRELIFIWDITKQALGDYDPADYNDDYFI